MYKFIVTILSLLILLSCTSLYAQSDTIFDEYDESDNKILLRKEWSISGIASSGGIGLGYRKGNHITAFKKRMLEIEFTSMKHPKEIKSLNPYDNAKSYVYGKINNLCILRTGVGIQKLINEKPLWGGVEVKYFYYFGASLGITKPVYLYIINFSMPGEYNITLEKYDYNEHFVDNIYGRGPFSKGFNDLKLHPGIYTKVGFNFEYGSDDSALRALETGVCIDFYPKPVEMMAFNDSDYYFISFYVSLNFGKRSY